MEHNKHKDAEICQHCKKTAGKKPLFCIELAIRVPRKGTCTAFLRDK